MVLKSVIKNISNLPGWRTKRKIVVIESDDWGSIRMPSQQAFRSLKEAGLSVESGDAARFNKYDTLASKEDFMLLFDTLGKFKDCNGNNPMFTAVSLSANPDFEKIKNDDFQHYYNEPFTQTLQKYKREGAFEMWQEGLDKKLFVPEFHGREHLNVASWMRALQNKDKETTIAFEHQCWSFKRKNTFVNYQAAFDVEKPEDLVTQTEIFEQGLALFHQIHGFKARFFVPTNGPFNSKMEPILKKEGIDFISVSKIHLEPLGNQKFKRKFSWLGKTNTLGQMYITRNAFFEPNYAHKGFSVSDCLSHVEIAFKFNKPAVISTHRVNYIGVTDEKNRIAGNNSLNSLLAELLKKWPDIEFMTSTQLGNLMRDDKK